MCRIILYTSCESQSGETCSVLTFWTTEPPLNWMLPLYPVVIISWLGSLLHNFLSLLLFLSQLIWNVLLMSNSEWGFIYKHQVSQRGKTLNILCLYCFHLRCQKGSASCHIQFYSCFTRQLFWNPGWSKFKNHIS